MRTIKYALLGMLNRESMSGYELMKLFEGSLAEFWSVKHSQIYPELKRLYEEGMVTYTVEISGTVLERKIYSITDAGREDFLRWLKANHPMRPTPKEEFRLQLYYAAALPQEEQLALIKSQLTQHEVRLAHLRENQNAFGNVPPVGTYECSDYMVLLGAIAREEATCQWLRACLALLSGDGTEPISS